MRSGRRRDAWNSFTETSQSGQQYPADFTGPLGPNDTLSPIPFHPPRADADANIELTAQHPRDVFWFRDQARNNGPWDYKQYPDLALIRDS